MWRLISTTMGTRSVILSTHSMEECEALCGKIGIMVNGRLMCLGSPAGLKSTHGHGFQLDVTFVPDCDFKIALSRLNRFIATRFPRASARLIEGNVAPGSPQEAYRQR